MLRNLIAASEDEVRQENMPKLLNDLRGIVIEGELDGVTTFNQAQVADERLKRKFLEKYLKLERSSFRLEDHPILRGSLASFELDATTFTARAEAFDSVFSNPENWPLVTGALLATGEYQRERPRSGAFQFGTGSKEHEGVWRYVLTGTGRANLAPTRAVLAELLDHVAGSDEPTETCLVNVTDAWLTAMAESRVLAWRYYFVKYDCMREGESGIYYGADGKLGYSVVMLRKTILNSWYRDPYLLAIWHESGVDDAADDPWFIGYETGERWLRLTRSGTRMRCAEEGIALQGPSDDEHLAQFMTALEQRDDVVKAGDGFRLAVQQVQRDGTAVDAEDRVRKGAKLLRELVAAGL